MYIDDSSCTCKNWYRSDKYDLKQLNATYIFHSLYKDLMVDGVKCSTKLEQSSYRCCLCLSPNAVKRSLVILTRTVSVLWCILKAEWNTSNKLFLCRKSHEWLGTSFLRILERKGKLEIALWLTKLDQEWAF